MKQIGMIVFYSEYCSHSRMLVENIKRQPTQALVKIVCVENLRAKGIQIPPAISAVPALVLVRENGGRQVLMGKQVFDYLLMPGRGILMTTPPPTATAMAATAATGATAAPPMAGPATDSPVQAATSEPEAFVLDAGGPNSAFAFITDGEYNDTLMDDNRPQPWGSIMDVPLTSDIKLHEDTRGSAKPALDVDRLRQERERDLQNVYEGHGADVAALPLPAMTSERR